jgi:hypothetical protein
LQKWRDESHTPVTADQEASVTLALAGIEHDSEMLRQHNLLGLFDTMRRSQSGWISAIP